MIDEHDPDGYNLGWNIYPTGGQNVDHAHLHLIPRYKDEPLATKGIRYAFKQSSNRRKSR
ncbi:MAG TPA: HIT domain-containing protein [Candidatus Limnocylindria bacterium]|nr:HIT domain-containing protein [Candidatus Limnocylindria bacterium]